MFWGCTSLSDANLSGFDTSQIRSMKGMFCNCKSLTTVNLSSFNTSNTTDMSTMFQKAGSDLSLNLSNFDTSALKAIYPPGGRPGESGAYNMFNGASIDTLTLGPNFSVPTAPDSFDYDWGLGDGDWKTEYEGLMIKPEPSLAAWQNEHLGAVHTYLSHAPTPGWIWTDAGWKYINEDGSYNANEWSFIDGSWYYFKDNGIIESNCWAWIGDAWYGFWANGAMCTGWVWDSGYSDYFYCGADGRMVKGVWDFIDGEWYGFWADGTMCRGWVWDSSWNSWFFCYASGVMARNTWIDGYWVNASGIWV